MELFEKQLQYWTHMLDESTSSNNRMNEAKMSVDQRRQFDAQLAQGTVEFDYYKKEKDDAGNLTGNLVRRHAKGTLNPALMPSEQEQRQLASQHNVDYDNFVQTREARKSYMVPYWDLDAAAQNGWGWRQFHVSRFIGVTNFVPNNNGSNTTRNGNTFVHTNRVQPADVTPQVVATVNSSLRGIGQNIAAANGGNGTAILTFQMTDNVPTLIYNIDMTASQNDMAAFRLTIEDVVRQIFQQHGILIEKIRADVDITWN